MRQYASRPLRIAFRRYSVLTICLVSACGAGTDEAARSVDPGGATGRPRVGLAVPVSAVVDSIVTNSDSGPEAAGPSYEALVYGSVLPDDANTRPVVLAPSDTFGGWNYQAAGWWMGRDDKSARQRWRFSAQFERFPSGVVVIKLDTLLARDQQQSPFYTATADSIAFRGLRAPERLSTVCRLSGYRSDDRILGLLPDSSSGRWIKPRLAWFVDTVASRFRRMKPDAVACRLDGEPN